MRLVLLALHAASSARQVPTAPVRCVVLTAITLLHGPVSAVRPPQELDQEACSPYQAFLLDDLVNAHLETQASHIACLIDSWRRES